MALRSADIDRSDIDRMRMRLPRAFGRPPMERALFLALWGIALVFLAWCLIRFEVNPVRVWNGLDRLGLIAGDMLRPSAGGDFWYFLQALLESIAMAFLGTLIASVIGLPLGIMAARNVLPNRVTRFILRRNFEFLRGIDPLIWALVYVRAVGLGPLAGILAIATSDTGTMAKLYSEAIETADRRTADGVRASGGSTVQVIRLGMLPQVLPVMLANTLYMFESNTRSATILGVVGAGGIGFELSDRIRSHQWDQVGFIILMIIAAVATIDVISHNIRSRMINAGRDLPSSPTIRLARRLGRLARRAGQPIQ
jgi:phosphonate transport system permease protein